MSAVSFADDEKAPGDSTEPVNYNVFKGNWKRVDGTYTIHVKETWSDGQARVDYFNPNPILVENASVSIEKNLRRLYIRLQDKGYEGSTYWLYYFQDKDALVGFYRPGSSDQTYEVIFLREK